MRLVPTARVKDGAELGKDVLVARADGIPLLRRGARITAAYRDRLVLAGIHAVYIVDDASEGIEPEQIISEETRALATRTVASTYQSVQQAMATGRAVSEATIEALSDIVARILAEIESTGGVALALADLASADAYTLQHSIDVAALGLLLGQRYFRQHGWLDYQGNRRFTRMDERMTQLGLGLILHDIGKLAVPTEILNKPGKLDSHEWAIMQAHPRLGVELLSGGEWTPLVKAIVLRHHERWNGSGYPDRKVGDEIHEMARIAAIADVYDAITSQRPYAPARPASAGVRVIAEGAGTLFDGDMVEVFTSLVAPFPPGVEVELADGRHGVVVSVPERNLDRPLVRLLDGPDPQAEIDLATHPAVRIAGWDREPVTLAA